MAQPSGCASRASGWAGGAGVPVVVASARADRVSDDTYRAAAARLREALDVLGPYRGRCGCCGGPDARHQVADAITGRLLAGEDTATVADDYGIGAGLDQGWRCAHAWMLAAVVAEARPRRHTLTFGRAAGIDREVWADVLEPVAP